MASSRSLRRAEFAVECRMTAESFLGAFNQSVVTISALLNMEDGDVVTP